MAMSRDITKDSLTLAARHIYDRLVCRDDNSAITSSTVASVGAATSTRDSIVVALDSTPTSVSVGLFSLRSSSLS
jgi:hypothetical protein